MKHVPIKEAKDKLMSLVRGAEAGERVTITRNGKPVADLVPQEKGGRVKLRGDRGVEEAAWRRPHRHLHPG